MLLPRCVAAILAVALVATPLRPLAQEVPATAADLIRSARRLVGYVVRAARDDTALAPDSADAKPLYGALRELNEALDRADTGLTLKDNTFHSSLGVAGAAARQAEVALTMNDAATEAVREPMGRLATVVRTLNETYGKEAARRREGGALTPAERRQLAELKSKQTELEDKLRTVENRLGQSDEKIAEGARQIRENSQRIRRAANTVDGFVGAMLAARFMSELIWGWHWWWGPWGYWGPGFINVNIVIWDTWFIDYGYDWDLVDVAVDVDDLDLELLDDVDTTDFEGVDDWLDAGDFSLDDDDMAALTDELPSGWDDVDTGIGLEVMEGFESNFDTSPFDGLDDVSTFDDFDFADFGDDFDFDF